VSINVNDWPPGDRDPFKVTPEGDRWQFGAVGAYYDVADNFVWALVDRRDSAPDDFELLLMLLRDRFAGIDPGTPVWDDRGQAWLYRITVDLGEDWAARRRVTLARIGVPKNGRSHTLPTVDVVTGQDAVYIVTDPDCADGDWQAACRILAGAGWNMDGDDIGEPEHDPLVGTWAWTIPIPLLTSGKN